MKQSSTMKLWNTLLSHQLVQDAEPPETEDNAPWYVRTMLGIAGWVGAIFLLSALFSGFALVMDSVVAATVMGIAACSLAVVMYRAVKHNDFTEQFAFAVSLAGQSLLIYSAMRGLNLFDSVKDFVYQVRWVALILVALHTVLFLLVPNYLHRVWSAVIGVGSLAFLSNQYGLFPFTLVLLMAGASVVWLKEFHWARFGEQSRALGYALVLVSVAHLLTQNYFWNEGHFWQEVFGIRALGGEWGEWLSGLLLGVVLVAVVVVLLQRERLSLSGRVGIAAIGLAIVFGLIGAQAPGITIGVTLVLLGFAHGNNVITGIGLVTVVAFVSQFYYLLHLTLLYKSILLFFSGIGLLLVRQVLHRLWPRVEQSDA